LTFTAPAIQQPHHRRELGQHEDPGAEEVEVGNALQFDLVGHGVAHRDLALRAVLQGGPKHLGHHARLLVAKLHRGRLAPVGQLLLEAAQEVFQIGVGAAVQPPPPNNQRQADQAENREHAQEKGPVGLDDPL